VRGVVISVHNLGATVRLEDGRLAAIPLEDVRGQRSRLTASWRRREPLEFDLAQAPGRHPVARPAGPEAPLPPASPPRVEAPGLDAPAGFEAAMSEYLKSLEEREGADRPSPADRHALRKKKRAAWFEARRGPA
jgi:hypothetical protein